MVYLRKGKELTNLWRVRSLKGASKEKCGHPTQKPCDLIERIIQSNSKPGEWIVDPFVGSGTTAVAAQKWGRQWTGIEISEQYAAIAQERIGKEKRLLGMNDIRTTDEPCSICGHTQANNAHHGTQSCTCDAS